MSVLPDERDLPPGRHAVLRHRLDAGLNPTRERRRWLLPVAAATAAAGVLAAAVAVGALRDDPTTATPGSGPPVTPGMDTSIPVTPMPGTTPPVAITPTPDGGIQAIVDGCAASYGVGTGAGDHGPYATRAPAADDLETYNEITDEAGQLVLLYASELSLTCTVDGPGMPYNAGGAGVNTHELTGSFDVDHDTAAAGGDVPGGKASHQGRPGYRVIAGRVTPEVAKVTVTSEGRTAEATPVNGTFLVRLLYPSTWEIPERIHATEVRAYDRNGAELSDDGDARSWP